MKTIEKLTELIGSFVEINKDQSVNFVYALKNGVWSILNSNKAYISDQNVYATSKIKEDVSKIHLYENGWLAVRTPKGITLKFSDGTLKEDLPEFPKVDVYRNRYLENTQFKGVYKLVDDYEFEIRKEVSDAVFSKDAYALFFNSATHSDFRVFDNDNNVLFEISDKTIYQAEIFSSGVSVRLTPDNTTEIWEYYTFDGVCKVSAEMEATKIKVFDAKDVPKSWRLEIPTYHEDLIFIKTKHERGWKMFSFLTSANDSRTDFVIGFEFYDFECLPNYCVAIQERADSKFKVYDDDMKVIMSTHGTVVLSNGWYHTKENTLCTENGTVILSGVRNLFETEIGLFLLIGNSVYVVDLRVKPSEYKAILGSLLKAEISMIEQEYLLNYAQVIKMIFSKPYSEKIAINQLNAILSCED